MLDKIRAIFGAQDMTTGKPWSCLMKFTIPMLIGNIAQMMLTVIDRAVVGQYMGDAALSAVGASVQVYNIFLVFFMAVGSGVTVMVAQYFGAKDKERLGLTVGNTITLMIILSVFVTALAIPLTSPVLRAVETAEEIFDLSKTYLLVLFIGSFSVGFYNSFSGILRGLGSSIFPLVVLLISVLMNAILDIWFVSPRGLNMGIAGAAYATVIAQTFSAAACFIQVLRMKHMFKISISMLKLRRKIVGQIVRLGLPTGIQMAIMFLSNLIVQPYIMRMGYHIMAAITATMSVDGFAVMPSQAFSMGIATYTGQNIGAGKMERLKPGMFATMRTCLGFTIVMLGAILIFGRQILGLFTETEALIEMCMGFIYILIPAYIIMGINMTLNGVMRGAGDALGTMWLSVITNVILKVPLTLLLINLSKTAELPNGNPNAQYYAMLICMCVGLTMSVIYFRMGRWKTKSIVAAVQ